MARHKEIIATATFPEYDFKLRKLGPYDVDPTRRYEVQRKCHRLADRGFVNDAFFVSASDAFQHFNRRCIEQAPTL